MHRRLVCQRTPGLPRNECRGPGSDDGSAALLKDAGSVDSRVTIASVIRSFPRQRTETLALDQPGGAPPVSLHHVVENLIHRLRYRQVEPFVRPCNQMVDLGCGRSYTFLKMHHDKA